MNFLHPTPPMASHAADSEASTFSRFANTLRSLPSIASSQQESISTQSGAFESFTKGIVDSSKNALKAMQVKARHVVSQNKRRFQEGGFDLDMTYITENIIAMGFPAGDVSSGIFGFLEGLYRNHMQEVIGYFETHHRGKYKVYNLCSERLYDASLFEGKVACFPFDDHNCPPLHLITSFCQSAHSWLKEDIENVVVVHCKAGMGRTGLMICSLLLFLNFFPTADEAIEYFNQKRCIDGKGLILPSQIRYVKYFERILTYFGGEVQPSRRCMLRGFRLHKCPYWIRPSITISNHSGVLFSTRKHPKTKDLMPGDFWMNAPKKGIAVFALPGDPGLTELIGDFKIHFHDRQGDFYCWLNTTMTENRKVLNMSDLDGFDKRKLPSPGFQVEVVMMDLPTSSPPIPKPEPPVKAHSPGDTSTQNGIPTTNSDQNSVTECEDDVFSDSDRDNNVTPGRSRETLRGSQTDDPGHVPKPETNQTSTVTHEVELLSIRKQDPVKPEPAGASTTHEKPASGFKMGGLDSVGIGDIKAIAADASVFTFGDDEDYESE